MKLTLRICLYLVFVAGLSIPGLNAAVAQGSGTTDIRIWTSTANGDPVYDMCYTLANYSNLGCDENQDGAVLFENIPYGTYTVEPTSQDGGSHVASPFTITVDADRTDFSVIAEERSTGNVDLNLITRDPKTGDSLTDVCYVLAGYSNEGCDDNADGKVSFKDIPYGDYTVHQTHTPKGYDAVKDYTISLIPPPNGYTGPISLIVSQTPRQADDNHTNISVMFIDVHSNELILNKDNCLRLVTDDGTPLTRTGCDDDVIDGQIDFLNVEVSDTMRIDFETMALQCPYVPIASASGPVIVQYGDTNTLVFFRVEKAPVNCTGN